MTNRQFHFSFFVGLAFIALGSVLLGASSVGFSLMGLGAGIAALAVFTRTVQGKDKPALAPSLSQLRESAPDY